MSDFFPEQDAPAESLLEDAPQPVWLNPSTDVLPGVVPVELILGRSDRAAVLLTGIRAFATGLAMTLQVCTRERIRRFDLHAAVFDGPYGHDQDEVWFRDRLKWGFEYSDGRRATNVDTWPAHIDPHHSPDGPVLSGGGGGGDDRSVDCDYWLWPLPPAGPLKVVCQWPQLGIEATSSHIDGEQVVAAAARAQAIWS